MYLAQGNELMMSSDGNPVELLNTLECRQGFQLRQFCLFGSGRRCGYLGDGGTVVCRLPMMRWGLGRDVCSLKPNGEKSANPGIATR